MSSSRSIEDIQQDFANNLGYGTEIIWDSLSADQSDILKNKIKELIPDQEKGQKAIIETRNILFNNIWAQRKYTNRISLSSIIYVLVTKEPDFNLAKDAKEFSCHPVFRTRRCNADSYSSTCCMIFIDEVGRVYQNWQSFVKDNVLPKGTMVAPHRGVYTFNEHNRVKLDIYATPASSTTNQVLAVADTTSATAGFVSVCFPIAALLSVPIAAPVMAVAAGVGLGAAGYSTLRSSSSLIDRSQHEQSIGLGDRQARNSWLGVLGGLVGLGASGATRAMTSAAAAGSEISLIRQLVVNGINISSIVLSGTGVANGALDMLLKYNDDEKITALDVLQLSASLFLFTHSVRNFRLASNIINETRNGTIQEYRKGLSNRQRRMFDKMSKETIRIRGDTRGKIDIIRSVNDIPSKQYLNDLYKINKNLNKENVRPAFGSAGEGVVLNNEVPVDTQVLRNSVQHNIGADVLGQVTQPIPQAHSEANLVNSSGAKLPAMLLFANPINEHVNMGGNSQLAAGVNMLQYCTLLLADGTAIALSDFNFMFERIVNAESFENVITAMAEWFSEAAFRFLMHLAKTFMEKIVPEIHNVIQTFVSMESLLYRILDHCMKNYEVLTYEFLKTKAEEISETIKTYFLSLNPNSNPELLKKCQVCVGYFAICDI